MSPTSKEEYDGYGTPYFLPFLLFIIMTPDLPHQLIYLHPPTFFSFPPHFLLPHRPPWLYSQFSLPAVALGE